MTVESGDTEDAHGATAAVQKGSLYDPADRPDDGSAFGEPGDPLSRSAAFYRGLWGGAGLLVSLALGLVVLELTSVLVLVVVSAFLAIGLNPIVELLIRVGLKRGVAVLVVALGALTSISLIGFLLVSLLSDQVTSFFTDGPRILDRLLQHGWIRHLNDRYHFITDLQEKLKDPDLSSKVMNEVFHAGIPALEGLLSGIVVMVLTLYFLAGLPQLKRAMYSLAPASRRQRVTQLGDEILHRTGRFAVGSALVALLAGTLTLILLLCVGLGEYALPLALFVALLDLIPLVGSATGAIVVTLICFATSLDAGIAAAAFYLIYEPLEGYVIYPRVMRSSVDVPEYVTIIAVIAGGTLGGIVGALLALPFAAGGLLLIREVWVRRQDDLTGNSQPGAPPPGRVATGDQDASGLNPARPWPGSSAG